MSVKSVKNKPLLYGLTGGIASGKSTVANYLLNKGVLVFDSDLAVKEIWSSNLELMSYILNKYDIDINEVSGKRNLAKLMYNNKTIKDELEKLIHPLVFKMIDDFVKLNNTKDFLVIDMPLLYEVEYHKNLYKTILVYVTKDVHINRLIKRDKITIEEAKLKISSQLDLDYKYTKANYILNNNGTKTNLYKQIDILIKELENESKQ